MYDVADEGAGADRVRRLLGKRALQSTWPWLIVLTLVGIGVAMRTTHLGQWPSGFRWTVEFDLANAARTLFLRLNTHDAPWQEYWLDAGIGRFHEPPVLQTLTALTYLPDGIERPWTSVIFTVIFWTLGALLAAAAVRALTGLWGAMLTLAYLLLAPFAVAVSQSFQVEALLFLGFAAVVWYASTRTVTERRAFLGATTLGALALLAKPAILLPYVAAVFVFSATRENGLRDPRKLIAVVALIVLSAVPSVAYAAIWLLDKARINMIPGLLTSTGFYAGWSDNVIRVVGFIPLVGGILGFLLTPRLRAIGFLFLLSYLGYSAVFTWHTMTHDYGQVPLLLIVAIGLGGLGDAMARWSMRSPMRKVTASVGIAVAATLTAVSAPADLLGRTPWRYPDQERLATIGSLLGAGERVIAFSRNYGLPLMYYGKLIVSAWPTRSDIDFEAQRGLPSMLAEVRLQRMIGDTLAEYFVVTLPARSDAELIALLECRYKAVLSGPDWQVYDLSSAPSDGRLCTSAMPAER